MYDKNNKETIWQRTEENMFTDILFDFIPFKHDACEETWEAYYTYGDPCFIEGLKNCIKKVYRTGWKAKIFGEYYYQLQRWPTSYENMIGMSRDHLIYVFSALYKYGISSDELHEYVSHLRPVVSTTIGMHMTFELWLWLKLISKRKIGILYYPWRLVGSTLNMLWTKLIYKLANWPEELSLDEYWPRRDERLNKSFKDRIFSSLVAPVYSRKLTSTKVSLLPDNWWTKSIKKIELMTTTRYNYVLRMLNGDKTVKREDIEAYHSILYYRWSDSFEPWRTVRWMTEIPKDRGYDLVNIYHINQIDRDYALKIYDELIG
jgi:hypothetical protein